MSTSISYTFTYSSIYTFNSSEINISSATALLALQDKTTQVYSQDFGSSASFIFDSTKAEFSAGQAQQVDLQPSGSIFGASYTSDEDLEDWSIGNRTGSLNGAATVSSGKLDCSGQVVAYCKYLTTAVPLNIGTIRFKFTPDYSGVPGSNQWIFNDVATSGFANDFQLYHSGSGNIQLFVREGSSVFISVVLGSWLPTSGQEYEFEVDYDFTNGETRVFIDGTQLGSLTTSTGTRSSNGRFILGAEWSESTPFDGLFDDVIIFDSVQHTTNYTAGYSVPVNKYTQSIVELPQFIYLDCGDVQNYDAITITESGDPRYTFNNQYWGGTSWSTSDNTYAQANPSSDVEVNISSLEASSVLNVKISFTDSTSQSSVDDLNIEYTGQKYSTSNPTIETVTTFRTDGLVSFSETSTGSTDTLLRHTLVVDSTDTYWTGLAWSSADGTYTQTNLSSDINTNAATLTTELSIDIGVKSFLHTDTDCSTPELNQIDATFSLAGVPPTMNSHTYYGYFKNPDNTNLTGKTVQVRTDIIQNSNVLMNNDYITTTIRSDGYWDIDVYWEDEQPDRLYWYIDDKQIITNFTTATNNHAELRVYRG